MTRALARVCARVTILAVLAARSAFADADRGREILTRELGVFVQPPEWAPSSIGGRYVPWGLHATNETLRATTQTGAIVASLVDGYYERYAVRSEAMPSGGLQLTWTNGSSSVYFDTLTRDLWPTNGAWDNVGVVQAWDGYPGGERAMTNSLRFADYAPYFAVRTLLRPDFMDYGGYELEQMLFEDGLTNGPPISTDWETTIDFEPEHWINVYPRLRDLKYDGIVRSTAAIPEPYTRNHLAAWLGDLGECGSDVDGDASAMLSSIAVVPLGAHTNYPATRTGGYDLRDLMVWWRGGAATNATAWLAAYTNNSHRLSWDAAGAAAYLMSQMDRAYYAPQTGVADLYSAHVFETASLTRIYDAPTTAVTVNSTGSGAADPGALTWSYQSETATTNAWTDFGNGVCAFAETTSATIDYGGVQPNPPDVFWSSSNAWLEVVSRGLNAAQPVAGETVIVRCNIEGGSAYYGWGNMFIDAQTATNLTFGFERSAAGFVYSATFPTNEFQVVFNAGLTRSARSRYTSEARDALGDAFIRSNLWERAMVALATVADLQCSMAVKGYLPGGYWTDNGPGFSHDATAAHSPRSRLFRRAPALSLTLNTYSALCSAADSDALTMRTRMFQDFETVSNGRTVHALDWCREDAADDIDMIKGGSIQIQALAVPHSNSQLDIKAVFQADGSAAFSAYWDDEPATDLVSSQGINVGYISVTASGTRHLTPTNCASAEAVDFPLVCPLWDFRNLIDRPIEPD